MLSSDLLFGAPLVLTMTCCVMGGQYARATWRTDGESPGHGGDCLLLSHPQLFRPWASMQSEPSCNRSRQESDHRPQAQDCGNRFRASSHACCNPTCQSERVHVAMRWRVRMVGGTEHEANPSPTGAWAAAGEMASVRWLRWPVGERS